MNKSGNPSILMNRNGQTFRIKSGQKPYQNSLKELDDIMKKINFKEAQSMEQVNMIYNLTTKSQDQSKNQQGRIRIDAVVESRERRQVHQNSKLRKEVINNVAKFANMNAYGRGQETDQLLGVKAMKFGGPQGKDASLLEYRNP